MPTQTITSFLDAVVARGRVLMGLTATGRRGADDLPALTEALLSRRGEASGVALASEILDILGTINRDERIAYAELLAERFGADRDRLDRAVEAWRDDPSPPRELSLHVAAEPRRQEVLRRLNHAPGGTAALVNLRAQLLDVLDERPGLDVVDADFLHLFGSWFNRGFLVIRRIDWTTPANILEKIIAYEAVHAIRDWNDLRNRLEPADRRLYAFFHPRLADEPLVFVEVALTKAIPDKIAPLLDLSRTPSSEPPTTAVFYSISNTQKGLRGVSFGNFLIKQVVEELKRDFPSLTTFVTLSPVPGFARWLDKTRDSGEAGLTAEDWAVLDRPDWHLDPEACAALQGPLTSAAAYYLLNAKTAGGRPVDPVARFHLGNGARLERIDWLGDLSAKGRDSAHGIMVNYLYDLTAIEANHEAFAERGEVVAHPGVKRLVKTAPRQPARAEA